MDEKMEEKKNESYHDDFRYHHHAHGAKMILAVLFGLIILGGVFMLGRATDRGQFEARKTVSFGNFQTTQNPQMMNGRGMMGRGGFERTNGMIGSVTAISGSNVTVLINNTSYTVTVSDSTSFSKAGNIAKFSDLKVGDAISIRGQSNSSGNINATVITIN